MPYQNVSGGLAAAWFGIVLLAVTTSNVVRP